MPVCYHCGRELSETILCAECGQTYCSIHRDPVDHECKIVKESLKLNQDQFTIPPYQEPTYIQYQQQYPQPTQMSSVSRGTTDGTYIWYRQEQQIPPNAFDPDSGIEFKGILLSHKSELFHFLIGCILIFIIGLINFYDQQLFSLGYGWSLFMLAGFYMTAFLFHELGHRQTALHFGLQTKFRLLTFGMLITAIGLISGLIGLISGSSLLPSLALPGAVVVLGLDKIDRKTGLCKAAGPVVNLVYGSILFIISFIIPQALYPLNYFFGLAAYLNYMLGTFNMIPIGILDGQNIWKWNKRVYIALMASLTTLVVITGIIVYTPASIDLYF
ncbi:MAG: hypothetical protein ACFE85_02440 [Candidatus Hodarchaeota archaeon]